MYIHDQVFLSLVSYKGGCESCSPAGFQSDLTTSAKVKRWTWRNLPVRRTTTILLWIMTSIAQQPLESRGTHSADVQTLISDLTMFPWNGNNIRKVRSGGFRSLLLSRWPLKCLARDVTSISKQGSQPRAKCILSFHQQLKWASVQQHSVPVFLRTPNPPSRLRLQREQAERRSFYVSTSSTAQGSNQVLPLHYMHR